MLTIDVLNAEIQLCRILVTGHHGEKRAKGNSAFREQVSFTRLNIEGAVYKLLILVVRVSPLE